MIDENQEYPKISIITVVFNGAKTLEQTILSVVNQTYKNIEYIIIDGGSTDGSLDIIRRYEDRVAYWISETDEGIYDAMNKGIEIATGDFIGIINSDDWYEINAVALIVEHFKNNPELEGVCGDVLIHLRFNEYNMTRVSHSSVNLLDIKKRMSIDHPTVFLKKSFYLNYGKFNPEFSVAADYELLLSAILKGAKLGYIPFLIAHFRLGGASSDQLKVLKDVIKIKKLYNIGLISIVSFAVREYCTCIYVKILSFFPSWLFLYIKRIRGWKLINE